MAISFHVHVLQQSLSMCLKPLKVFNLSKHERDGQEDSFRNKEGPQSIERDSTVQRKKSAHDDATINENALFVGKRRRLVIKLLIYKF